MSPDHGIESDESALWQAIREAPHDDAPWLVYADWLEERGQSREATAIRQYLPDVRAAILTGCEPSNVTAHLARYEPLGPGWGLALSPPTLHPTPAPSIPDSRPNPPSHDRLLLWIGILVLMTLSRIVIEFVDSQNKEQDPATPKTPIKLPAGFERDELAGYTFRQVDGKEELTLELAEDGTAMVTMRLGGRRAIQLPGKWQLALFGELRVFHQENRVVFTMEKVKADGNRYTVRRDGSRQTLIRERTPIPGPE